MTQFPPDNEPLSDEEALQLEDALLSAFRSATALEEMASTQLKVALDAIIPQGTLPERVVDLIGWAAREDRVRDLLQGAMAVSAGSFCLRAFREKYEEVRAIRRCGLAPPLRKQLVDCLARIPPLQTLLGRDSILSGIPTSALRRDPNTVVTDLMLIVDTLEQLGRLESGYWPLLIMIENALTYTAGVPASTNTLTQIGRTLAAAYGVKNASQWP